VTEKEIIHHLIGTNRMHKKIIDNFTSGLGLHRSQHILLMILANGTEALNQEQIAKRLGISPAAVAVKIKKLETDGLISRERVDGDCRTNLVKITNKGMAVKKKTECVFSEIDKKTLAGITEEEIQVFVSVLNKMQDNLSQIENQTKGDCN